MNNRHLHVCFFSEITRTFFNGNNVGDFKTREQISHFWGFYLCLIFDDVLKYTMNKYLDKSGTYFLSFNNWLRMIFLTFSRKERFAIFFDINRKSWHDKSTKKMDSSKNSFNEYGKINLAIFFCIAPEIACRKIAPSLHKIATKRVKCYMYYQFYKIAVSPNGKVT